MIKCKLADGAVMPSYQSAGAAGADISAFFENDELVLKAGEFKAIPTGVYLEIPVGYEVQVRPRSGLAFKYGITVLNTPGTIDSDYRGEIKICLINHSKNDYIIKNHERIAQLVFSKVESADYTLSIDISLTKRGISGFGSTGK